MVRRLAAAITAGMAVLAASTVFAADRHPLVIASGEVTGYYYPVAGALCRVVNKDRPQGFVCSVEPTSGSAANVQALKSGDAELAILQSHAAQLALQGGEGFKDGAIPELRALMSLHGEATLLIARSEAQIQQMADIKGKRVNVGRPGSFQRSMAGTVLSAVGLSEGDLGAAVELDPGDAARELCAGNLDGAFFSGVHPMAEVTATIEQCDANIVSLPAKTGGNPRHSPWLSRIIVKEGTYEGMKGDVTALGLRALLVATSRMPAEEVYDLLKSLHSNFGVLGRLHPVLKEIKKSESAYDGISIPLHEGASKFYSDTGLAK